MTAKEIADQFYEEALRTGGLPDGEGERVASYDELYGAAEILQKYLNVVRVRPYDAETDISDGAEADSR